MIVVRILHTISLCLSGPISLESEHVPTHTHTHAHTRARTNANPNLSNPQKGSLEASFLVKLLPIRNQLSILQP